MASDTSDSRHVLALPSRPSLGLASRAAVCHLRGPASGLFDSPESKSVASDDLPSAAGLRRLQELALCTPESTSAVSDDALSDVGLSRLQELALQACERLDSDAASLDADVSYGRLAPEAARESRRNDAHQLANYCGRKAALAIADDGSGEVGAGEALLMAASADDDLASCPAGPVYLDAADAASLGLHVEDPDTELDGDVEVHRPSFSHYYVKGGRRHRRSLPLRLASSAQQRGHTETRPRSTGCVTGRPAQRELGILPDSAGGTPDRATSSLAGRLERPLAAAGKHWGGALDLDESTIMDALLESERDLIRELFAFYVGPGGKSLGAGLGLSRFRRFLRDCGLIVQDEGDPRSRSHTMPSKRHTLFLSQADLIFSRVAKVDGQLAMRLATPGYLATALADVAAHCFKDGASASSTDPVALRKMCCELLSPLRDRLRLQRGDCWDVSSAASVVSEAEIVGVLQRSQRRLASIFFRYACGVGAAPPYRRGHWTAASISRFAAEAGLGKALNHATLYRLFDDITDQEFQSGQGKEDMLSFHAFQVCLVAIAERTFRSMKPSSTDRLRVLLLRLNALSAQDLATFQA